MVVDLFTYAPGSKNLASVMIYGKAVIATSKQLDCSFVQPTSIQIPPCKPGYSSYQATSDGPDTTDLSSMLFRARAISSPTYITSRVSHARAGLVFIYPPEAIVLFDNTRKKKNNNHTHALIRFLSICLSLYP